MGNGELLASELSSVLAAISSASKTLITALPSLDSMAKRIEERLASLVELEDSLKRRQQLIDHAYADLEQREAELEKRITQLAASSIDLQKKMREWDRMQERMAVSSSRCSEVITLNVGGQLFTTTKTTLTKYQGSLFTAILTNSGPSVLQQGTLLIDRNPKNFELILNYLREGSLSEFSHQDPKEIQAEFEFYNIPVPPMPQVNRLFRPYKPLFDNSGLLKHWESFLSTWLHEHHFILIYKGTQDGFSPSAYHSCCDNRGATLTIIQSESSHTFGAFIRTVGEDHTLHPSSFLFTLSNPHNIPPTKYTLKKGTWQPMPYSASKHIQLGGKRWFSCDIELSSAPRWNEASQIRFPCSFKDSTGKGKATFTGSEYFKVSEVEVYSVIRARVSTKGVS